MPATIGTSGPDVIVMDNDEFDTILAEGGDDLVNPGWGDGILDGGDGIDTLELRYGLFGYDELGNPATGASNIISAPYLRMLLDEDTYATHISHVSLVEAWAWWNSSHSAHNEIIVSGFEAVDIVSTDWDDWLVGGEYADSFIAQDGNDRIYSNGGDDYIDAGAGDDSVRAAVHGTWFGGSGVDYLQADLSWTTQDILLRPGLTTTVTEAGFPDTEFQGFETFALTLGSGNDDVRVEQHSEHYDYFSGGDGDDTFDPARGDADIDGGDGIDRLILDYSQHGINDGGSWASPAYVRLLRSDNQYDLATTLSEATHIRAYEWYNSSTIDADIINLTSIEAIDFTGSVHDDHMAGGEFEDRFIGNHGNDQFLGNGGVDHAEGGAGNDNILRMSKGYWDGGDGYDFLQADLSWYDGDVTINQLTMSRIAVGTDDQTAIRGFERFDLTLGNGADRVIIANDNEGTDTIRAGGGLDVINPGLGDGVLDGGRGRDKLVLDYSLHALRGDDYSSEATSGYIELRNAADDPAWHLSDATYFFAWEWFSSSVSSVDEVEISNFEVVDFTGSVKDDWFAGGDYADIFFGGRGNDSFVGNDGNDRMDGGEGDDRMWAGNGRDVLAGGDGNDELRGGDGNDQLTTGDGTDIADGDEGNDRITGGAGNNTLIGGLGRDRLNGGDGIDTFLYETVDDTGTGGLRDTIRNFELGVDMIDLSALAGGSLVFSTSGPAGGGTASVSTRVLGAHSIVQIDADGDGTVDAEIAVLSVVGLTSSDFDL